MPIHPVFHTPVALELDPTKMASFQHYLPLDIFDDHFLDCRTPEEWLDLGLEDGIRKPVPARALIASSNEDFGKKPTESRVKYMWCDVGVLDYNPETMLYLVHRVDQFGRVVDEHGNSVVDDGVIKRGNIPLLPCQTWVPRIQLHFRAEDPRAFARRVANAYMARLDCETELRYHLCIDCMPMDDVVELERSSFERMKNFVLTTPRIIQKKGLTEKFLICLENEVRIDFMRAMNRIDFDRTVTAYPEHFGYVTLPVRPEIPVPYSTRHPDVPMYPFKIQREKLIFYYTMVPHARCVKAMSAVRAECNKVSWGMQLFSLPQPKPQRLEDFDLSQTQVQHQVSAYLKDNWLRTVITAIRTNLMDLGKGWYNIHETKYYIYTLSPLKRYMETVKFMMQDSLRYLVLDSLTLFTQVIVDACESVMELDENFTWGNDLKKSPFKPKRLPMWTMDLDLTPEGAKYSTKLNIFETYLLTIFDKAILATQNIQQVEKFVMEDIFFAATPLLETVGKLEGQVVKMRETVRHAIQQAIIPLEAYAAEFSQYLPVFNTIIPTYINEFKKKPHSPMDVQREVQKNLTERVVVDEAIPMSIVIGPFHLITEPIRSNLSKKRKAMAHAIMDLYASELKVKTEESCNAMKDINRKLFDKPNSIEELVAIQEWMKSIPEKLREHTEITDKMFDEHEVLADYKYNLTNEDFKLKWEAKGWPHKIEQQMERTNDVLNEDRERFKKLQVSDALNFEERIASAAIVVASMQSHSDIKKGHEIANEMRRVNKNIKECQQLATLYNSRERLFDLPITNYDKVGKLAKDFEPYRNLWITVSDWLRWQESWLNDPLNMLNAEDIEKNVNESFKTMHKSVKIFSDIPAVLEVAMNIKSLIEDFKPKIPLLSGLRNPGMRARHWEKLSEQLGMNLKPKADLTFSKCLEMKLLDHVEVISKVAEVAGKEYAIEQALNKMTAEWEDVNFEVQPYKNTGTYIQKVTDDILQQIDDHIVLTQSMTFSPYKAAFEDRINRWEQTLRMTQDVLDAWIECQRSWMYLEPIFSSEDITRQLPTESKRYNTVERMWRKIMTKCNAYPKIIELCPDPTLLKNLRACNELLEQVQKGLSEYLETKRNSFPRFYFLSDDELLEILSQTRDPTAVQPHLRKCFENIYRLKFEKDLKITKIYSAEFEEIDFRETLYPVGNVEDWMCEIERNMRQSLREIISDALKIYKKSQRTKFVLEWPGQVVIAVCQTYWSAEVTEALESQTLHDRFEVMLMQLDNLRNLVRQDVSTIGRMTLSALIVIEVHARDVVANMLKENVTSTNAFEWISQLRYYWMEDNNLYQRAVNAQFPYGYEYLGNTLRLVITPLTDRCYLTLTGALHLRFGGAPAGPAGTGKTETTKDLAKAFAIQCVVFNCSDQLDVLAMGKFFKGLASSGAWACFDEFNRIDIEVLSVVAQQVTTIQKAQQQRVERFIFEGVEITLKPSVAVFITMNPGYAGRTELPDNLKALFRPVAMMVPDYALIAEISLFSFGFAEAKALSKKITTTFKLSSEQLSSQDHYDFGMRAVKSVISAAGNLKRQSPDMNEELIALRAIRDVNVPKFLVDDLKLFSGIVSDLFPAISALAEEPIDYGSLDESLHSTCKEQNLQDVPGFMKKCIQLYETTVVRHGLMLVGPAGSGKTKAYKVLQGAMTSLAGTMSPSGANFEKVHTYVLNPKSITMGQLYGEFDAITHEWTDGILSSLIRMGAATDDKDKRWYVFDGPVDAVWIENMNTVLDDNKKLCLTSGEIIKLTEPMTLMFEVADLAVASPATVSRCGMVYLEPSYIGLEPFVDCWLNTLPPLIKPYRQKFKELFDFFMEPAIAFVRKTLREIVTTTDGGLVFSLLKLLYCFFTPFVVKEGEKPPKEEILGILPDLIEPWFIFALIWSIGATSDGDSRFAFSDWLRQTMESFKFQIQFPAKGLVYDYNIDSILNKSDEDEEEEEGEGKDKKVSWKNWLSGMAPYQLLPGTKFSDILVPTIDTTRCMHVIGMMVEAKTPILCVGPTGTGKTMTIADKLLRALPKEYVPDFIAFSAKTSANQTQDLIDGKLDKRRKGIFGPPLGKFFVFFIDDLNMPAREVYGAQPPIELIRQYMDFYGWYDRKAIGEFRHLVDVNFVCAMGPPGGGRNPVTTRLLRHFNFLSFPEMEDPSKHKIFATILHSWIDRNEAIKSMCEQLVDTCISCYDAIQTQMLPTPAKCHYTFNLRDLSKVFQGILMAESTKIESEESLLGLWYHESCRVYQDRLVNDEDRAWFDNLCGNKMMDDFRIQIETVVTQRPFLCCDFSSGSGSDRLYGYASDHDKLVKVLDEYLEDYNQVSTAPMRLVLFMDAVKHVCRITRIVRQPLGNALLLGMGGSGRQSLTRLSAHVMEYDCFQIELSKNYGINEWKDDLRKVMMKAGIEGQPVVFLFSDTQIKRESFLEDLNNILNSGDVPNIYGMDEEEQIYTAMKSPVLEMGLPPTKTNLFSAYKKSVRSNLHTVITMSPLGEIFRARLRQFPALVNCCTIDWFSEWPAEALQSVALRFLNDIADLDCTDMVLQGLVSVCKEIHQSVFTFSARFLAELSRHNYVTPTSFLELLGIFSKLIGIKTTEITNNQRRLKTGLDKLLTTADEVAVMQIELADMSPELEAAVEEAKLTMKKIAKDTEIAGETKREVQKQKAAATAKANEAQAIADSAQRDLNEALPALDAALASLKSLSKNDVVEVKSMQKPPAGVRLVIEAVCIMQGVKPKKIAGEKLGTKVDDYWDSGKNLLQDAGKFLDSLFTYDKENIPDSVISKIQPYMENENFMPEAIQKVSKACTSICQWVRAMHTYHFVSKAVAPKREALKLASEELAETQKILDIAMQRLKEVEDGLKKLEMTYKQCVDKKTDLENKCKQCEARLIRADKLIGGLAGEKDRWAESVTLLSELVTKIVGDVLIAAGAVAYLGSFTGEFRQEMTAEWIRQLDKYNVPHTEHPNLVDTMSDPVKVRNWQIAGLPKDNLSVENGVIVQFSRRWPLFIDPQGQANKWVRNMGKDDGIDVVKLSDKDLLRVLENAIRFGKPCLIENVGTELDPSLEPVLLKQVYKQQGNLVIKLGDNVVPYHYDFRLYVTTKLPNPHYTPEISTKVTLVNFTLSPSGLQDQLIGIVVAEERPDLEEAKSQLIINNAKMKADLKEIEEKILYRLSASEGSPVDDVDLIQTLEASKITSDEIKMKVKAAEVTEKDIDKTRMNYVPVAVNAQLLFFCVADMSKIDPMYQYSLEWFIAIFISSIRQAAKAEEFEQRITNVNDFFTFSLYCNVCRSLFETHKLMFAFLLSARINLFYGIIQMEEYRHFVAGGTSTPKVMENPAPSWLSTRSWNEILTLGALKTFSAFVEDFSNHIDHFKMIFDSQEPHKEDLPGEWNTEFDQFQKMLILKALRLDKVTNAMQEYVAVNLGQRFIEPQSINLGEVFKESSSVMPLIFVLSTGTDPANELYKLAEELKFSKKLSAISLGQGQGPIAEEMMKLAIEQGKWVFFQNCHLAPSWMPSLEHLVEQLDPTKMHKDFRLWLTSMPSEKFPVYILQNGSKMTVEPPKGIKANLLRSYATFTDDFLESCKNKSVTFKHLLLSLCLFHGVLLERRKFGALGFNIPYEFTDGDRRICISQLQMFLMEYEDIPYKVLKYTAGHINYGGRVTDDWDRRCLMNILNDFYAEQVLHSDHLYSENGIYHQLPDEIDINGSVAYIRSLPINDTPDIFGLHDNANITFAQNETNLLLTGLVNLQPKTTGGGGKSQEEVMEETARRIAKEIPNSIEIESVMTKYPVLYEQSMNTVLAQEVIRYNKLLNTIHRSLSDLLKALKGLVVMSGELEEMAYSLYDNCVPSMWAGKAYPSLKPLGSWVIDLEHRMKFINSWIDDGIPAVFWISGFFFPQAFLTGTLQNYARKVKIPIDTIGFDFQAMKEPVKSISAGPEDGCYIYGMFVEGARWDSDKQELAESRPKELFTDMPAFWLIPSQNRETPTSGIYESPLYKTLTRAGTLSTTGHSTNFVFTMEVPTSLSQQHWIKRGVAMLCALNY
ncbi:dynein heavy chain 1, axonemal-like [Pomacea canaliculata]|uniref:dynein heavy chain 1, axonemal-like n=1 Tax=Pomacea canaliculata TaxID=400727 RepID=UPI000D725789|nr:dynein heavy chain 1, axonemal-like [Pomacea canaliculata]